MKRRSFLAGLLAAPMVPVAAKAVEPGLAIDAVPFKVIDRADCQPLVFEDGVLRFRDANIGEVTGGIIKSTDGKLAFGLANGVLTITS